MDSEAQKIARNFSVPMQGGPPPLELQFPGLSLPVFREGLALLRQEYAKTRSEIEKKYDFLLPEFLYDARLHRTGDREAAEKTRRELLQELGDDDLPDDSLELEEKWIEAAMLLSLRDGLARLEIPLSIVDEDGTATPPRVPYAEIRLELSPDSAMLIAAGKKRFQLEAKFMNQPEIKKDIGKVTDLLERLESLSYQVGLLEP